MGDRKGKAVKRGPTANSSIEDLANFIADKPDFELRETSEGKMEVFVRSLQKILDPSLNTVNGFYVGKKYQKTLA